MKYTHSRNIRSSFSTSPSSPKPWIDATKDDEKAVVEAYYHKHLFVYDADICGNEEMDFSFSTGKAFKLESSYWIEYNPEWEIHNEYYITEIDMKELPSWMQKERDWIA